jgi:hypothetical protein
MELGRLHVAGRAGAARCEDADAIVHGCLCADHLSLPCAGVVIPLAGALVESARRCDTHTQPVRADVTVR